VFHLPGLENPALRVDQWNAFTAEIEPARKIGGVPERRLLALLAGSLG
jgi:hypothetical protein